MQPIHQANAAYESWLRAQLDGDIIERDLGDKRVKMAKGPFPFLRATYWRWAETILDVCPELAKAPPVLAVGDVHLENFGTWRDQDGRLVWGVNDFDEGAEMPYPLDLVRLATSALLARPSSGVGAKAVCAAIIEGYGEGLSDPRPFVLDEKHAWLRGLFEVPDVEREGFWKKIDKLARAPNAPAERYRRVIAGAMPERGIDIKFRPRSAGTGSLGRPRWVGMAEWRGGRVVREARALVESGWTAVGRGTRSRRCKELAFGRYRAPDPWYDVVDAIIVRRLSPNSRKIEVDDGPDKLLDARMLRAMGHELANVHLGSGQRRAAIDRDLNERKRGWLREAAAAATEFVTAEHREWTRTRAGANSCEPTGRQGR
jgi:Uncharacterized protein conserved in bacteria (DUF2252)